MNFINKYLNETIDIINKLDYIKINKIHTILCMTKSIQGRLFILGIGGSAANASHAVNDFRKIMNIESYTPTDNIAEFSARINDDGWDTSFINYLKYSNLTSIDCVMILSVSGGSKNKSANIIYALDYAKMVGATTIGIVGGDGGYTAKVTDVCIIIPTINDKMITPHAEELQSIILHLLVNK